MDRLKGYVIFLIACVFLLSPIWGCSDRVNYSKGDKVVGSFIQGQVESNEELVNSVITTNLKNKLEKGQDYFWDKYKLEDPNLTKVSIYELQSSQDKKLISASYLVEAKEEKINVASLYFLVKEKEKWLIEYIEEIAINKSL